MSARLVGIALANWLPLDGFAVGHGLPPLGDLPIERLCAFVYWWATRNAQEEKDVARFDRQLWLPPAPDVEVKAGPWSPEAEMASLRGLKASLAQ